MITQLKTDLPSTYKIRNAAETLGSIMPTGTKAVYLIGHGAQRDWESGVGKIYTEYLGDLSVIFVPQDDYKRPGGYRPIQTSPRGLRVKGASAGLVFDSSAKEFTVVNDIDVPTSSSHSGAFIDLLRFADYLEIPVFFSSVTSDFSGISTIPIDPVYMEKNRTYFGPRKFLELNLVSFKVSSSQVRNMIDYNTFREQLRLGKIEPQRLRRYERYLRHIGKWSGNKSLEDIVIPNLNHIGEYENSRENGHDLPVILSEVIRRA